MLFFSSEIPVKTWNISTKKAIKSAKKKKK